MLSLKYANFPRSNKRLVAFPALSCLFIASLRQRSFDNFDLFGYVTSH